MTPRRTTIQIASFLLLSAGIAVAQTPSTQPCPVGQSVKPRHALGMHSPVMQSWPAGHSEVTLHFDVVWQCDRDCRWADRII